MRDNLKLNEEKKKLDAKTEGKRGMTAEVDEVSCKRLGVL